MVLFADSPDTEPQFSRDIGLVEHVVNNHLARLAGFRATQPFGGAETQQVEATTHRLVSALAASAALAARQDPDLDAWQRMQLMRGNSDRNVAAAASLARTDPDTCLAAIPDLLIGPLGLTDGASVLSRDPRTDIPSKPADFPFPVWAGIGAVDMNLRLTADQGAVLGATIDARVQVSAANRGAHMSRLQQAIHELEPREFSSLVEAASTLAELAYSRQPCNAARVVLTARHKFPTRSLRSGAASSVTVHSTVEVRHDPTTASYKSALEVAIMTACPCTLMYSHLRAAEVTGDDLAARLPPTFTHSQPGLLTLAVQGQRSEVPDSAELLGIASSAAHLREAVLKRADEHDLVERVHRDPQFTEDVVRRAAVYLASTLEADTTIEVMASLSESIHPHTAEASISGMARDFWQQPRRD